MPLVLVLLLAWPAFGADKEAVGLVEFFLKAQTADLPPDAVAAFMAVDAKVLPAKLRPSFEAKKLELLALRRLAEGRKRPAFAPRRLGLDPPKCGEPAKGTPSLLTAWRFAGFKEATPDELRMAEEELNCSECELETEFTLQRMRWDEGKDSRIRYFFSGKDPVWVFITVKREGLKGGTGTSFFGAGGLARCH